MYTPDPQAFCAMAERARTVPVYRDLSADLETPISVFLKLCGNGPAFLLESVEHGEQLGRYTFLGVNPRTIVEIKGTRGVVSSRGQSEEVVLQGEDGLHLLRRLLASYRVARVEGLPRFFGGAVGYIAYDAVRFFERVDMPDQDELELPDAVFMLTDAVIVFDHVRRQMKIISLARIDGSPAAAYSAAAYEIERVAAKLAQPLPTPEKRRGGVDDQLTSNVDQSDFESRVRRAKEYIAAGDAFQIVLSQRFRRRTSADAFAIYRALRMLNPSPYLFFLDIGQFQLIGSSPEGLVKLEDGWAETNPIAGTRPRGRNEVEDKALAAELIADPKERAEHLMLVDLGRNDIGRVAEYGTVCVPDLMRVEKYSHVMHLVSRVTGRLRPEHDAFSLLRAAFPAGTVSGAPKVRAMQIISELEGMRRGPYAGAVGYFALNGNMDTCIAIRTIVKRGDTVYLQAGAGIVADSDPTREYFETIDKARALEVAIIAAEAGGKE
ncbi:MAG: anthranilate synthase component I [Chloroflexota bacterium]